MAKIVFCLGSNIGNRQYFLEQATTLLQKRLNLQNLQQSSILENKALLIEGSPPTWNLDFYNMAVCGDINLKIFSPLGILKITQQIESDLGRVYRGKWSPREIDIDIAAIDDLKINIGKMLQIPHYQLFERDFFLQNIKEIAPQILLKLQN